MFKLDSCKPGSYKILTTKPLSSRLEELGFISGKKLYLIANNILGIRIRINNVVYLFDKDTASTIYVQPIEV
jgi:Fe2+ transport system protein FeoA